jgi:hypothetical protein
VKRSLFAVAVAGLFAADAAAQSPAPVVAAPATPVVVPGPVMSTMPAPTTTARRGLFGRLRGGRTTSMSMSAPATMPYPGTVITTPGTGTTLPGTVVPAPMPMPAGSGSSAVPAVTGNPVVMAGGVMDRNVVMMPAREMLVPAGGMVTSGGTVMPAGGVMTTGSMVMPASGTVMTGDVTMPAPTMMMSTSSTSTGRMGLFGRLRARR